MIPKQEELINRYFEHGMSSGEEQNFLISLAASDDMRIAFRSHLELMKAVREDKDSLRSVAQVRTRTLTALGLSAAAVTPFIEQELVRSSREPIQQMASIRSPFEGVRGGGKAGLVSSLFRTPKYALIGGVLLGFLGSVAVMNVGQQPADHVVTRTVGDVRDNSVSAPTNSQIVNSPSQETIPAANGLNRVQETGSRALNERSSATRLTPSGVRTSHNPATAAGTTGKLPEITVSGHGGLSVQPATIKSANDSAKGR